MHKSKQVKVSSLTRPYLKQSHLTEPRTRGGVAYDKTVYQELNNPYHNEKQHLFSTSLNSRTNLNLKHFNTPQKSFFEGRRSIDKPPRKMLKKKYSHHKNSTSDMKKGRPHQDLMKDYKSPIQSKRDKRPSDHKHTVICSHPKLPKKGIVKQSRNLTQKTKIISNLNRSSDDFDTQIWHNAPIPNESDALTLEHPSYTDLNHTEEAVEKTPIRLLNSSPQTFLENAYKSHNDHPQKPNQVAHKERLQKLHVHSIKTACKDRATVNLSVDNRSEDHFQIASEHERQTDYINLKQDFRASHKSKDRLYKQHRPGSFISSHFRQSHSPINFSGHKEQYKLNNQITLEAGSTPSVEDDSESSNEHTRAHKHFNQTLRDQSNKVLHESQWDNGAQKRKSIHDQKSSYNSANSVLDENQIGHTRMTNLIRKSKPIDNTRLTYNKRFHHENKSSSSSSNRLFSPASSKPYLLPSENYMSPEPTYQKLKSNINSSTKLAKQSTQPSSGMHSTWRPVYTSSKTNPKTSSMYTAKKQGSYQDIKMRDTATAHPKKVPQQSIKDKMMPKYSNSESRVQRNQDQSRFKALKHVGSMDSEDFNPKYDVLSNDKVGSHISTSSQHMSQLKDKFHSKLKEKGDYGNLSKKYMHPQLNSSLGQREKRHFRQKQKQEIRRLDVKLQRQSTNQSNLTKSEKSPITNRGNVINAKYDPNARNIFTGGKSILQSGAQNISHKSSPNKHGITKPRAFVSSSASRSKRVEPQMCKKKYHRRIPHKVVDLDKSDLGPSQQMISHNPDLRIADISDVDDIMDGPFISPRNPHVRPMSKLQEQQRSIISHSRQSVASTISKPLLRHSQHSKSMVDDDHPKRGSEEQKNVPKTNKKPKRGFSRLATPRRNSIHEYQEEEIRTSDEMKEADDFTENVPTLYQKQQALPLLISPLRNHHRQPSRSIMTAQKPQHLLISPMQAKNDVDTSIEENETHINMGSIGLTTEKKQKSLKFIQQKQGDDNGFQTNGEIMFSQIKETVHERTEQDTQNTAGFGDHGAKSYLFPKYESQKSRTDFDQGPFSNIGPIGSPLQDTPSSNVAADTPKKPQSGKARSDGSENIFQSNETQKFRISHLENPSISQRNLVEQFDHAQLLDGTSRQRLEGYGTQPHMTSELNTSQQVMNTSYTDKNEEDFDQFNIDEGSSCPEKSSKSEEKCIPATIENKPKHLRGRTDLTRSKCIPEDTDISIQMSTPSKHHNPSAPENVDTFRGPEFNQKLGQLMKSAQRKSKILPTCSITPNKPVQISKQRDICCDCGKDKVKWACNNAYEWVKIDKRFNYSKAKQIYQAVDLNISRHAQDEETQQEVEFQIEKDMPRTFPSEGYFMTEQRQEALKRVLVAYSKYEKTIGYVQGMNFVAGMLLYHCDEVAAFWLLVALIEDYELHEVYQPGLPALNTHSEAFFHLLQEKEIEVVEYFEQIDVIPVIFFSDWLFTMFGSILPLKLTHVFLTNFFKGRWEYFYNLGLIIIQTLKDDLLEEEENSEITTLLKLGKFEVQEFLKRKQRSKWTIMKIFKSNEIDNEQADVLWFQFWEQLLNKAKYN